jgi:hypothetical protein
VVVAQPIGGQTMLKPGEVEGTLAMTSAGKTTVLEPLSEHQ